jgi:hypothetical protein
MVKPTPGLLSDTLIQKLKAPAPNSSDQAQIVDALRSVSPDSLKAELSKAAPQERHQLFSVVPNDQIKSIIGSLSANVLAPDAPPPPAPAPTAGPPASILQTTYVNAPYPPAASDKDWASKISNGQTIATASYVNPFAAAPPLEWMSVYDPSIEREGSLSNPMVGLTGWVVNPSLSQNDVWFVHPFGNDFEFYIVPDPQYNGLLAKSNASTDTTTEFGQANAAADQIGLTGHEGVLGVETDHGLVPQSFQSLIVQGARIAAFGRWIVDCGHPDFHTEIHAPLLMAVATVGPAPAGATSQMTTVNFVSRPYTVSQKFSEGNFIQHLKREVEKVEASIFGIPLSTRVEAHPTIFTTPYEGRPFIKLLVQPPPAQLRTVAVPQQLMVNFHFTHRAGVAVQVFDAGNGSVGIFIVLGDLNPAALPPKHDLTIQWSQIKADYPEVGDILDVTEILDIILGTGIAAAIILNRGILTDSYDPPSPTSPLDNQNVAGPVAVSQIPSGAGSSETDGQPFPLYGWLKVWWQEAQLVNRGNQ